MNRRPKFGSQLRSYGTSDTRFLELDNNRPIGDDRSTPSPLAAVRHLGRSRIGRCDACERERGEQSDPVAETGYQLTPPEAGKRPPAHEVPPPNLLNLDVHRPYPKTPKSTGIR